MLGRSTTINFHLEEVFRNKGAGLLLRKRAYVSHKKTRTRKIQLKDTTIDFCPSFDQIWASITQYPSKPHAVSEIFVT